MQNSIYFCNVFSFSFPHKIIPKSDYGLIFRFVFCLNVLISGLSKHTHMAVISYSAEGGSFRDRDKYPYFFRTIGENKQYEHVYVRLFKELNWHRVVAFTEDGQKYTEYISQLENLLRENDIELTNKKFSKYFSPDKIRNVSLVNCIKNHPI